MTDEPDTSADFAGTDNVETSEADTSEPWDYYDPEDDEQSEPDTGEVSEETGTDDGAGETEAESDEEEADETPERQSADETAYVKLSDGTELTVAELSKGYFRQADYTRKSQELANTRKAIEADASRVEAITQTFVDHLASLMPPEPDAGLALRDPNKYVAQKAQYDAAAAQMQKLIEIGAQPKQIKDGIAQGDRQALVAEENQKLIEAFPEAGTANGRQKFFEDVQTVANDLGFSTDELSQITDHRVFALAHWAQKGMAAEQARTKAKAKAKAAPQVAPTKPGQPARASGRNREAMQKLSRSGSLRDAMNIDFD